jgi:hypothetical protein
MPRGSKIDRMHRAIARSMGGKNASGRAWATMVSRGYVRRRGRHMVGTMKLRHTGKSRR